MRPLCSPTRPRFWTVGFGLLAILILGRAEQSPSAKEDLGKRLHAFVAVKEEQTRALATEQKLKLPDKVWEFFEQARGSDWVTTSNLYNQLAVQSGHAANQIDTKLFVSAWQPVVEVDMALEQSRLMGARHALAFGDGIINSLPKGAVYFGGTDPGRGLVTALCSSHTQGEPFFTITQNLLVDETYLAYLRFMYGQLKVPDLTEVTKAFADYSADAATRHAEKRMRPGEEFTELPDGRVSVSGQTAVMDINGRLARMLIEKNPDREIFIEESFPLDWMYPHLTPHGLILKFNREPLKRLPSEAVDRDHEHWGRLTEKLLGRWLLSDTPLETVQSFCRRIYLRKEMGGFEGDRSYVGHPEAAKNFGKLRLAQASLYEWRAGNTEFTDERKAMTAEADLAYRQALALGAPNGEVFHRYGRFLNEQKRTAEARALIALGRELLPDEAALKNAEKFLKRQP